MAICYYVTCLVLLLHWAQALRSQDFYTAAVFEHIKYDEPGDRPGAIQRNLNEYEDAAVEAVSQGADIIVFPEASIMPAIGVTPVEMKEYYEEVPTPAESTPFIPCHSETTTNQTVLMRLSCIARDAGIYVVANIGEKDPCVPEEDSSCPAVTKMLFYNTDVVFDTNGTLIARHRKRFPFFEAHISRPKLPEYTVFNTSFGSFGVIICFDSIFGEAVDLIERYHVENVIISTMWVDELPFLSAIQYFQAWALGNKVNVLAANRHKPRSGAIGSLIVSGTEGTLAYTFDPKLTSSKLLVARVPRNASASHNIVFNSESVNLAGYKHENVDLSEYTLRPLEEESASVQVCNNGLCCNLNYSSNSVPQDLYLAAFNGTRNIMHHYFFCQEVCLLVMCETGSNCNKFPTYSNVVFDRVSLSGNISTHHQYPSILADQMVLVPYQKWEFSPGFIAFNSGAIETPLLSVSIHGRCYDRDPPFPDQKFPAF